MSRGYKREGGKRGKRERGTASAREGYSPCEKRHGDDDVAPEGDPRSFLFDSRQHRCADVEMGREQHVSPNYSRLVEGGRTASEIA